MEHNAKRAELARKYRDETVAAIRSYPVEVSPARSIAGFHNPVLIRVARGTDNRHFSMNLHTLLELGFRGIAGEARRNAERLAGEEANFLRCIADCHEAAAAFASLHADRAEELALSAAGVEAEKLLQTAAVCRRIADGAPESFRGAVQLLWLAWNIRGRGTLGRLDQNFFPFYEKDLSSCGISRDEALALLVELWEAFNISGTGDTLMNLMVGGQDRDGNDATNEMSILMIEASSVVRKPEPHLNARLHAGVPERYRRKLAELQWLGQGHGTIYNDEAIVPSLVDKGVPIESARNYANDGCTEVTIDGESDIIFTQHEAVKSLELTLFNGKEAPRPGPAIGRYHARNRELREIHTNLKLGYETGDFTRMTSFDQLYEAFLDQYIHQLDHHYEAVSEWERLYREDEVTSPFLAGTFPRTLQSGVDPSRGGYGIPCRMIFSGSIPTAADCLAAIKSVVYEQEICTPAEMLEALSANFEDYEALRQHCLAAPKFGNDDDRVDLIAADIAEKFCRRIVRYHSHSGKPLWPALYNFLFNDHAKFLGATPDGRRWGDPIAEHYSPTPGRAENGPTAVIRSAAKGPLGDACGSSIFHVSLHRGVATDNGELLMRQLVDGAVAQGVAVMNIAVYDVEEMREAQAHPERHEDLVVRVWGFSARFIDLSDDMQNHIIQRAVSTAAAAPA